MALGFIALALSHLVVDRTAPDANIGAGILLIVGLPVGEAGLLVTVVAALTDRSTRRRIATGTAGAG